jgi:hypothetical protein
MTPRALLRAGSVAGALVCLGGVAWLALDWADYGTDSTCGNFIRYKGAGGTCARIVHGRILGAVVLGVAAIALIGCAWITRPRRTLESR